MSRSKSNPITSMRRRLSSVLLAGAMAVGLLAVSGGSVSADYDTVTQLTPSSPGAFSNDPVSVSCPTTSFCLVGGRSNESDPMMPGGAPASIYLSSWNGATWSVVPSSGLPSPFDIQELSCASSTFCVLVGNDNNNNSGLVFVWDGTSITQATLPTGVKGLESVSCPSTQFCMAAGASDENPSQSLVLKWNGSTWTREISTLFATAGKFQKMRDIDCDVSGRCVGVTISDESGTPTSQILDRNGVAGTWSAPTGRSDSLTRLSSIDCQAGELGRCTIYGTGQNYSSIAGLLYDLGSGSLQTRWTNVTFPVIATGNVNRPDAVEPYALSCVSSTQCLMVGSKWLVDPNRNASLVMTWNGATWTELPSATGTGRTYVTELSCPTTTQCMLIGRDNDLVKTMKYAAMAWFIRDAAQVAAPGATTTTTTTTTGARP